ncbi:MAG: NAD-dependent epimerase/dehydratase family protein [Nitrospiraceae bacterium]|nr:MAG: NAD-dependent epimerase/dehydratase family protein [Nitrospiraceae bacterium]
METVLLTGATGFLGSHLVERLVKEDCRVIALKRSFSDTWRIKHLLPDITTYDMDKASLENIFRENKLDAIIHTATTYGKKGEDNAAIIESNLLLPVRLLGLSASYNVGTFINTDSFFNTADLNYKYLSGYSLSKRQLVEWLKLLSGKIQIVNLRIEHLYGPGDSDSKFVIWIIRELIKNVPALKLTKGEQKRDFIYVSDAVDAFVTALNKRRELPAYSCFEVGTGGPISIRDFAVQVKKAVSEISGKEIGTVLDFGAVPYAEGEIMESKADDSALKKLGWDCSVSLREGLEKTIREILKH